MLFQARRGQDSNLRGFRLTCFQDRLLKPLGHLSPCAGKGAPPFYLLPVGPSRKGRMAEVRPFQGVRYRLGRPEAATEVIAPPYDVISAAQQQALYDRAPHNIIRLELPREQPGDDEAVNRYTRAAELYEEWRRSGVLQQDEAPCLYVYGQRYEVDGGKQERLGLMGALKVEPYEAGVV